MPHLTFKALPAAQAQALRTGRADANGMPSVPFAATTAGCICNMCLHLRPEGTAMLTAAYRPFRSLSIHALTGPVHICTEACTPWKGAALPDTLAALETLLLKPYDAEQRPLHGYGGSVPADTALDTCKRLFLMKSCAHIDLRDSTNQRFYLRITAGPG